MHLTQMEAGLGVATAHEVLVTLLEEIPDEGVREWIAAIGMLPSDSAILFVRLIRLVQMQAVPAAQAVGLPT